MTDRMFGKWAALKAEHERNRQIQAELEDRIGLTGEEAKLADRLKTHSLVISLMTELQAVGILPPEAVERIHARGAEIAQHMARMTLASHHQTARDISPEYGSEEEAQQWLRTLRGEAQWMTTQEPPLALEAQNVKNLKAALLQPKADPEPEA